MVQERTNWSLLNLLPEPPYFTIYKFYPLIQNNPFSVSLPSFFLFFCFQLFHMGKLNSQKITSKHKKTKGIKTQKARKFKDFNTNNTRSRALQTLIPLFHQLKYKTTQFKQNNFFFFFLHKPKIQTEPDNIFSFS